MRHEQFVDSFLTFLVLHKAEEVLPKTGRLRLLLEEWISDTPILSFVSDRVREELRDRREYVTGDDLKRLADIDGFGDTDAFAESLVSEFESLPWSYTLTTRFPDALPPLPQDQTTIELGLRSRLSISDLLFKQTYSVAHPDEQVRNRLAGASGALALLVDNDFAWEDAAPYFQFEPTGFIGPYGTGTQSDEANRALRRFVGLALGLKLFTHKPHYRPFTPARFWLLHRKVDEQWVAQDRFDIDNEDAGVLNGLQLWNGFSNSYPEEHKIPWLQGLLVRISKALTAASNANLGLAAEWYFDSFKGRDDTLTYVRRMTCLEILLGEHADTSKVSLGELLGNRLAYLVGRSHSERERVLRQFREIYGLRSRILHHGKHRFTMAERGTLWELGSLCERALQEEAKMITADSEK